MPTNHRAGYIIRRLTQKFKILCVRAYDTFPCMVDTEQSIIAFEKLLFRLQRYESVKWSNALRSFLWPFNSSFSRLNLNVLLYWTILIHNDVQYWIIWGATRQIDNGLRRILISSNEIRYKEEIFWEFWKNLIDCDGMRTTLTFATSNTRLRDQAVLSTKNKNSNDASPDNF